jgi:predicted transcriptional regulator
MPRSISEIAEELGRLKADLNEHLIHHDRTSTWREARGVGLAYAGVCQAIRELAAPEADDPVLGTSTVDPMRLKKRLAGSRL